MMVSGMAAAGDVGAVDVGMRWMAGKADVGVQPYACYASSLTTWHMHVTRAAPARQQMRLSRPVAETLLRLVTSFASMPSSRVLDQVFPDKSRSTTQPSLPQDPAAALDCVYNSARLDQCPSSCLSANPSTCALTPIPPPSLHLAMLQNSSAITDRPDLVDTTWPGTLSIFFAWIGLVWYIIVWIICVFGYTRLFVISLRASACLLTYSVADIVSTRNHRHSPRPPTRPTSPSSRYCVP